MRAIAPILVVAAWGVGTPALSASLTAPALNLEVTCTTNCETFCKRCVGAACAKDQCAAACEARRRTLCLAFPKPLPKKEEYDWAEGSSKFRLPDVGLTRGPVIVGPVIVPWAKGEFHEEAESFQLPKLELPQPDLAGPPPPAPAPVPPLTEAPKPAPHTAARPPPTSAPPAADNPDRPKARIIDTRSAPLLHPGDEEAGYGLYTYVLLRGRTDRDGDFLKDIVATAPSASGVAPSLRAQIDLMLIPANPCPAAAAKGAADCPALRVETIASDLEANYNYGESNTILEELCANPPKQIAAFCGAPFGQGPFVFTYARPVSRMDPIPPPFLFFDFTDQDEAAFPDYIDAYEAVLKSDDFTDDGKLKTLRLRILDVFNRAKAAAGPTAEGAVKLVHLFFPVEKTEAAKGGRGAVFWAAVCAVSLLVAIVYGVVFRSAYREPIDAQGGIVLFLLAFLTVLAALGLLRLLSRLVRRT